MGACCVKKRTINVDRMRKALLARTSDVSTITIDMTLPEEISRRQYEEWLDTFRRRMSAKHNVVFPVIEIFHRESYSAPGLVDFQAHYVGSRGLYSS